MHLKRWITGIVAVPSLFALLYYGGQLAFGLVIAVVASLTLKEYFAIVYAGQGSTGRSFLRISGYLSSLLLLFMTYTDYYRLVPALMAVDLLVVGSIVAGGYKSDQSLPLAAGMRVMGLVYIPLLASHLLMLRNAPGGGAWLFCLLVTVAAGDIGAYYCGSYLGRHKLCPAVSPNKTVEGAVGGLLANLVSGACFKLWLLVQVSWFQMAVFVVAVGLSGQVGDLFESAFKRNAGIKDSGRLLPGHGGFLDRIDALLFAAPVAYLLQEWITG